MTVTPEAWTFFGLAVTAVAGVATTVVIQSFTTKRAMLEELRKNAEKTDKAASAAESAAGSAGSAAESAAVTVQQTRSISNGTVPGIVRRLDEHGELLRRILDDQREQRTLIVGHLADHARVAMTQAMSSPPTMKPPTEGTAP